MVLHVRQLFLHRMDGRSFLPKDMRGTPPREFTEADLVGEWEIIRVQEPKYERQLEAGQILWGEGELKDGEWNLSTRVNLAKNGTCAGEMTDDEWKKCANEWKLVFSDRKTAINDRIGQRDN